MPTISKLMVALMATALVMSLAATAAADDSVAIEVRAIAASPDGDEFDSRLDDIEQRLERGFSDYSSFRQIDRHHKTIERDESAEFELPTGDVLVLSYNGRADDFVRLGLQLEDRFSTTLRATPGSTFFQAGLVYDESTLVLAITVE